MPVHQVLERRPLYLAVHDEPVLFRRFGWTEVSTQAALMIQITKCNVFCFNNVLKPFQIARVFRNLDNNHLGYVQDQ